MGKNILTLSLVLVMTLSFAACAKEPSAQEIIDGVIDSLDEIRTCQFDTDQTIDMTLDEEDGSYVLHGSYTVDVENRRMIMDTTIEEIAETGQSKLAWGGTQYFIDSMLYVKPKVTGEDPAWMKQEAPEGWWEEMYENGLFMSQMKFLETGQAEVLGSESIDSIDCYILEVTPDLGLLWKQYNNMIFQEATDVTEEYLQEIFRSFSVKQWVAKDTYFLMKVEIDIATELPLETPGPSKIEMAMALQAYNYNESVSIVLPQEAEEAIEVPME